jgi:sugar lactone lactonase YvrE
MAREVAASVRGAEIGTAGIAAGSNELPRITCPPRYIASVYAEGLAGPDGLAFSPAGVLHVAEETAGRVTRIAPDGDGTVVVSGLESPEGIAFDAAGTLYVVEDVEGGRLVQVATDGLATTLTSGLAAPEGVAWSAQTDTLYVTESTIQFASFPQEPLLTHVTAVSPQSGQATRLLTDTLRSYAGITVGPEGALYVTNEMSGAFTNDSIYAVDPQAGTRSLFASGLSAPEGLRFADGGFPFYVAEEDVGDHAGCLSRVAADGGHAPFCTGFQTIEDVALDAEGRLFVSEDGSGSIIVIEVQAQRRLWLPLVTRQ